MIATPLPDDGPRIHEITAAIEIFSPKEVQCVDELWQETQTQGAERSGYH